MLEQEKPACLREMRWGKEVTGQPAWLGASTQPCVTVEVPACPPQHLPLQEGSITSLQSLYASVRLQVVPEGTVVCVRARGLQGTGCASGVRLHQGTSIFCYRSVKTLCSRKWPLSLPASWFFSLGLPHGFCAWARYSRDPTCSWIQGSWFCRLDQTASVCVPSQQRKHPLSPPHLHGSHAGTPPLLVFQSRFLCVALAILELSMWTRLALNS